MDIIRLEQEIAQCRNNILLLEHEFASNQDLYIEGYGSVKELNKCQAKLQNLIRKEQAKLSKLTTRYNKIMRQLQ